MKQPWRNVRLAIFGFSTFAILLTLSGLSLFYAKSFTLPSYSPLLNTPENVGLSAQDITITTEDGIDLAAWYVPPVGTNDTVIIYLHGVGSNRSHLLDMASLLHDDGYGALLLDLRGHGESYAQYRTMGVYEVRDVQASVDYLLAQPDVNRVGVTGTSFGASVALISAGQIPEIEAVVAFSPYSSLVDVVGDRAWQMYKLPPRPAADFVMWWMLGETGANVYEASPRDGMAQMGDRPVLHVHGALDPVIPPSSAERIQAVAGEHVEYWYLEEVGHASDAYVLRNREEELVAFINEAFAR
ncbi:MAG: alpha/beta fold hydrolase [Chloroflexota bacterium]